MSLTLLQCCNVTVMQIKLTVLVVVLHGLTLNNRKWTCTMRGRNHQRFHVIEFRSKRRRNSTFHCLQSITIALIFAGSLNFFY